MERDIALFASVVFPPLSPLPQQHGPREADAAQQLLLTHFFLAGFLLNAEANLGAAEEEVFVEAVVVEAFVAVAGVVEELEEAGAAAGPVVGTLATGGTEDFCGKKVTMTGW